jgi:uncharacterized protein (DUF2062 family)
MDRLSQNMSSRKYLVRAALIGVLSGALLAVIIFALTFWVAYDVRVKYLANQRRRGAVEG